MVKCCTLYNMFRLKNPCSIGLIKFWLNFYVITNSKFTYLSTSRSKSPKPKNDGTLILFDHLTTKCIVEKKMYCWLTNLRMKRFNSTLVISHPIIIPDYLFSWKLPWGGKSGRKYIFLFCFYIASSSKSLSL